MAWQYSQVPLHPPSYAWSSYQTAQPPPIGSNSAFHTMNMDFSTPPLRNYPKQHRRRCVDYPTIVVLLSVWTFLTLSCIVLLFFSHVTSSEGETVSANEIARILALSSAPTLLATILNEVFVDRCWRRVIYSALGRNAAEFSDTKMANNIRAANFEWLNFLKRLCTFELSCQDFRALASYALLRWGTAISIASIQLCVSWNGDTKTGSYTANNRNLWLVGPVFLHACSIFGTMAIWFLPPWTLFSDRFDDHGLLKRYTPYLQRVIGGSVANYDTVAKHLAYRGRRDVSLARENKPGIQFLAKLKGIWFGLLFMNIPPAAAYAYTRYYLDQNDVLRYGVYRFAFHLVFLAQNILYILALDFAVWNISLEGFSKRRTGKPNRSLRHLGYSSGIMLLIRAFRQRRPIRAAILLWLFWLQACLMRFLTMLYTFCVTVLSYGSIDDRKGFYNPNFWLAWVIMMSIFVVPLFLIWLFTPFQAPICGQDGWRWAKIAQNAICEDGYYGVRNREAAWAINVEPFDACKGQKLL